MKKLILSCALLFFIIASCDNEKTLVEQQIQFEFTNVLSANGSASGGRTAGTEEPKGVLVTIKDINDNMIAEKKELTLYKFGDRFLSAPLTIKAGNGNYLLTEFFVVNEDQSILFVTPKAGSAFAHLVSRPLDIAFAIAQDQISTVTPEVIAVDDSSNAGDFGYGQFGFQPIRTIKAIFSSFIKGTSNFELTTSQIKIQGLSDTTSTDTSALWTYQTELSAKANTLVLREANYYRVVATKEGYRTWNKNLKLGQQSKTEILFDGSSLSGDVYIAGAQINGMFRYAAYWKNGQPVKLSNTAGSYANDVFISGNDVYVAGSETGVDNAFYWKNGQKVLIPFNNSNHDVANKILVNGNDVHIIGGSWPNYTKPAYWKNEVRIPLPVSGNFTRADALDIALDGTDTYVVGSEGMLSSTNDGDSYPRIWKNGVMSELALPSSDYKRTFANSIVVKNGHVYVCGYTTDPITFTEKAIFWKDNIPTLVELPGYISTRASAIYVEDNGTVHLTGSGSDASSFHPVYWKNGVRLTIEHQNDYLAHYYGVINSGSEIIVAGTYNHQAVYWKDGIRILLDNAEQSTASSIFFQPK